MAVLCEVRIPTYKRPELLRRALQSLQNQTHEHWQAIVFDDSPEAEAAAVVEECSDDRIHYRQNDRNLGGAGNIDQSFHGESYLGGSYAAILEDDNWWYETFLEDNLHTAQSGSFDIVICDQEVWEEKPEGSTNTHRTTRRFYEEGEIVPKDWYSMLLFAEGVSNGALFWKLNCGVNLVVGSEVYDPGLQEYCRTLQVDRPVYFLKKPLAVWSKMESDMITRAISDNRVWANGRLALSKYVLDQLGRGLIDLARQHATHPMMMKSLDDRLVELGYFKDSRAIGLKTEFERIKLFLKSTLRQWLVENPLKGYLQKKPLDQ
jgi:glycosyltransferase involved in cell wall biosynthesis